LAGNRRMEISAVWIKLERDKIGIDRIATLDKQRVYDQNMC